MLGKTIKRSNNKIIKAKRNAPLRSAKTIIAANSEGNRN